MSINMGEQTDNEKKLKGAITTNENDEDARVECNVYREFFRYCGGAWGVICVNIAMTGFITTKVGADWLVGQWSKADSIEQHAQFNYYCSM